MKHLVRIATILSLLSSLFHSVNAQWIQTNGPYLLKSVDAVDFKGNTFIGNVTGLYRSSDFGNSWTNVGFQQYEFRGVVVVDTQNIIIGTSNGIHWSSNNGVSWNSAQPAVDYFYGNGRSFARNSNNELFAVTWNSAGNGYLYKSIDKGRNWQKSLKPIQGIGLAIDTNNNIYVAGDTGIVKSTDGGYNWIKTGIVDYVHTIKAGPTNVLYAVKVGLEGLYRSTDYGDHWSVIGFLGSDVFGLNAESKDSIIVNSWSGISISLDGGDTWKITDQTKNYVSFLPIVYNAPTKLVRGNPDFGFFSSTDGGLNWEEIKARLPIATVYQIAIDNQDNIYAGAENDLYVSRDNGSSWERTYQGGVTFLVISKHGTVIAGTNQGIARSTDKGNTWATISPFPGKSVQNAALDKNGNICAMQVDDNGGTLAKSTDDGLTWQSFAQFTLPRVLTMTVDSSNFIYLGTFNSGIYRASLSSDTLVWKQSWSGQTRVYNFSTGGNGNIYASTYSSSNECVLRSNDNGLTWQAVGTSIGYPVWSIYSASPSQLYAGTPGGGAFYSSNSGDSWAYAGAGIISQMVYGFARNGAGYVFCGSYGAGVFKTTSPLTKIPDPKEKVRYAYSLEHNYPNPFNPTTDISFSLLSRSFVSLKIFDLIGKEVATLVSEELSAGNYSVSWTAQNAPTGVYFCFLRAGSFTQSRKMILMK